MIDGAKAQFALDHHLTNGVTVTKEQLRVYFHYGEWPKCPAGGQYSIGKTSDMDLDQEPKCTFPGHASYRLYPDSSYTNK